MTPGHLAVSALFALQTIASSLVVFAVTICVGNRRGGPRAGFRTVFVVLTYAGIPPAILWTVSVPTYYLTGLFYEVISVATAVWAVILLIKGTRAIYGHGTAKLLGILLLDLLAAAAVVLVMESAHMHWGYNVFWMPESFQQAV